MRNLFIFCKRGVAHEYGTGTFVRQFIAAFADEAVKLNIVYLVTGGQHFSEEVKGGIRYFYIPEPDTSALLEEEEVYGKKISIYFLLPFLHSVENPVFLFNCLEKECLIRLLREYCPSALILYVVHYLEWGGQVRDDELDFYHAVDKLICLSKETVRFLAEQKNIPDQKIVCIKNALEDRGERVSEELKLALRRKWYIHPHEKVLLFVGRVDPFKGMDFLIEAFKLFIKEEPESRLFIVGDGLLDVYTRKCDPAWSKITFTGKLDYEKVQELYQIADLGILPSLQEQCSFVAIEMLMYGLPTIVSAAPGLDEMFEEGVNTFRKVKLNCWHIIKREEVYDMYYAIQEAFGDSEKMREIGIKGRKCYEENYRLTRFRKEWASVWKTIF